MRAPSRCRVAGPRGRAALREALTGYLRRSRGVSAAADQILVTRGVSAGLRLVASALLQPGDRVGVEEPGYQAARAVFSSRGAQLVPCRVDGDGLVVEELPGDLRLVYTTPAHQYPLGGRLPVPRRQALAAWARATGALIVEDDYDGEFRYDVAPLPTLFGLDPDVVIYLGTTSKTLTPALGAGWLVARRDLLPVLTAAAADLGERVSGPVQLAVTELLASGELERHVRRMRHEYARRRAVMVTVLGGRLTGDTAGMHMVLELLPGTATAVAAAARERGVEVATLSATSPGRPPSRAWCSATARLTWLRSAAAARSSRGSWPGCPVPGAPGRHADRGQSRSAVRCRWPPAPTRCSRVPGRHRNGRPAPSCGGAAARAGPSPERAPCSAQATRGSRATSRASRRCRVRAPPGRR